MNKTIYQKLVRLLESKKFFWAIVGLFVIESAWIALSSRYPMAFDEDFHFGIIKIYARQWSPILSHQPAGADVYGELTRDPSYLYHYLMSFPYRLINVWIHSQTAQVIILRFIDIGLVAWGLTLFRKVLLRAKASPALTHTALLFFVLVPVVPLLAGQINYDDLLIPLTALALLLTLDFTDRLRKQKMFDTTLLLKLLALSLLTSLVKYPFLPIFLAIVVYLAYCLWRFARAHPRSLLKLAGQGWHAAKRASQITAIAVFVVGASLFIQRDGVNVIKYHTPAPSCNQVMSVKQCLAYGPWARDYHLNTNKKNPSKNPIVFAADWFYGMFERSFFMVNGPESGYKTKPYLPIIAWTAVVVGAGGILLFAYYGRRILRCNPALAFLLLAALIYCVALWLDNYSDFLKTGQAAAINGRYLFPIILPILLAMGLGYQYFLRHRPVPKGLLLVVVFLLFLQGGGALTFILRSDSSWYWQNNRPINDANRAVQKVIGPVVKK